MRIAEAPGGRSASDLTARARIRDAAVSCFAESGFDSSYRSIAARAGVSPGLITHHFGTKRALRAECDTEVLRRYQALKTDALGDPSGYLLERLETPGPAATVLVYILRAIHAGGQPARDFLDSLVEHARAVMVRSVATGLVRPSRDEEARLRLLVEQGTGALLVQYLLSPGLTPDAFVRSLGAGREASVLPILELYTEGFFTGRELLDGYLGARSGPPAAQTSTG